MKPQNNITQKVLVPNQKYRVTIKLGNTANFLAQETVYFTGIHTHDTYLQVYLFNRVNPNTNTKKTIRVASNLIENIVEIK